MAATGTLDGSSPQSSSSPLSLFSLPLFWWGGGEVGGAKTTAASKNGGGRRVRGEARFVSCEPTGARFPPARSYSSPRPPAGGEVTAGEGFWRRVGEDADAGGVSRGGEGGFISGRGAIGLDGREVEGLITGCLLVGYSTARLNFSSVPHFFSFVLFYFLYLVQGRGVGVGSGFGIRTGVLGLRGASSR